MSAELVYSSHRHGHRQYVARHKGYRIFYPPGVDPHRRTGRTTRVVEEALKQARAGKDVVLYVGTVPMVNYSRALAMWFAHEGINHKGQSRAFAGTLRFCYLARRHHALDHVTRRGKPELVQLFDHYWPEYD